LREFIWVAGDKGRDLARLGPGRAGAFVPAWCARVGSSLRELRDLAVARDAAPARPGTWFRGCPGRGLESFWPVILGVCGITLLFRGW
jgi:hypothetical protein